MALGCLKPLGRRPRAVILGALVVAAVTAFIGASLLYRSEVINGEGLGVDEGQYVYMGVRLARYGDIPYRDLFDHKPPMLYAFVAAIVGLGGDAIISPRWALGALTICSGLMLGRLTAFISKNRLIGIVSCTLYLFEFSILRFGSLIYTETLMVSCGVIGLAVAFTSNTRTIRRLFLAGFLLGLSFLSKQPGVIYVITAICWIMLTRWRPGLFVERSENQIRRAPVSEILSLSGGFAAINLAVILAFAHFGALSAYLEQAFLFNLSYRYAYDLFQRSGLLLIQLMKATPWLWIGVLVATSCLVLRDRWCVFAAAVVGIGMFGMSLVITVATEWHHVLLPDWSRWVIGWKVPLALGTLLALALAMLAVRSQRLSARLCRPDHHVVLCLLWFLVAYLMTVLLPTYLGGGVPIGSHAIAILAPASAISAVGFVDIIPELLAPAASRRRVAALITVVLALVSILEPSIHSLYAGESLNEQESRASALQSYIQQGKSMFSFPYQSGYYVLTQRYPPRGRYVYLTPPLWTEMERCAKVREEIYRIVLNADYVVDWRDKVEWNFHRFSQSMQQLYAKIRTSRQLVVSTEDFDLYGAPVVR